MKDRIERAFETWGHFVHRHALAVIVVVMAFSGGAMSQLPKLYFDTSSEGFFHEKDPLRIAYDDFRARFGQDSSALLVIEVPQAFDAATLARLRELHGALEAEVPYLHEVNSLINARSTRGEGDVLIVGDLMDDFVATPQSIAALRETVRANPLLLDMLVSSDEQLLFVLVEPDVYAQESGIDEIGGFEEAPAQPAAAAGRPAHLNGDQEREFIRSIRTVMQRFDTPDFRIRASGTPAIIDAFSTLMRADMERFTQLSAAMIAVLLFLLFRSLGAVLLPFFTVALSVTSTLALMAFLDTPLTLPTQILPTFLMTVGIGGAIHLIAIYHQKRHAGLSSEDAIAQTLAHSGLAICMASLTTAGGLASFAAAEMRPIAHFGYFGPIGVLIGLVFTLVLLPALMARFPLRMPPPPPHPQGFLSQRLLIAAGDLATRRPWAICGAWALLLVGAALGVSQLRFAHDPIRWFKPDQEIRQVTELVNDRIAASTALEVLVDTGRENGLHEPALLKGIEALQREAMSLRQGEVRIGKSTSSVDVLKEIHQALNENRSDFYRVPDERPLIAQEFLLFENSGSDDLEELVDSRFQLARISMRMPFGDAIQYPALFTRFEALAREHLGGEVRLTLTGMGAVIGYTIPALIHTMTQSYVSSLLIIVPMMIFMIGNLWMGLLAMIPNLTPIVLTLGLMGLFDIPLDAFTLLIGSIAIGLAVDDTIHFMHNFRRNYQQSGDTDGSVHATMSSTGQAMLFTSLVLSGGFFVYTFSSMDNLFNFGLLSGFTIVTAFLADALLTPALMVLATRRESAARREALALEESR